MRTINPAFRIEEIDTGHDVAGADADGLIQRVDAFIQDITKEQRS